MKINWRGFGALLTTAAGLVLSPAVLSMVSPKTAGIIVGAGGLLQALTHPAAEGVHLDQPPARPQ